MVVTEEEESVKKTNPMSKWNYRDIDATKQQ